VYAQLPWRANCFGIYGGGTTIQDSVCSDTQYPGILLGRMFNSNAFTTTKVTGVSLLRAGGPQYGEQGALKLNPEQGPVQNIQISNVDIDAATYSAVQFAAGNTIDTVSLAGVNITKPGGCGLLAQGGGSADMSNVTVSGAGELARLSAESAAELRQNVTSPKGTTLEAIKVLTVADGIQALFDRAIAAAAQRSRELAR